MKQVYGVVVCAVLLLCSLFAQAQQTGATATDGMVPPLVNFSGVLTDINNKPLTGVTGVTFSLYKEQQGGSPLWMETQNVQPDTTGHYTVMLGSTASTGLPSSIFMTGSAHWLAVQVQGREEEEARVLLVSAPYALKAGDAETVGGLPASAFVLAAPAAKSGTNSATSTAAVGSQSNSTAAPPASVTGSGTTNYIPKWTSSTAIGNSSLFQTGSGSSTKVGINTTTPADMLDVRGQGRFLVSTSTNALLGNQNGTGAAGNGVVGLTSSTAGYGVYGFSNSTTGTPVGVFGAAASGTGAGVSGSGGTGVVGASTVLASNGVAGPGGMFTGYSAVPGTSQVGFDGLHVFGGNGDPNDTGSAGGHGIVSYGGTGKAQFSGIGGNGIIAVGGAGYGDVGDGSGGVFTGGNGSFQNGDGVDAIGGSGVGVFAMGGDGNSSNGSTQGDGIDAYPGQPAGSGSYAGYFVGDVWVTGAITAGTKDFKIDHPQDPANKYLVHASVESSEMMNIYAGNVTTDSDGTATVLLPKWFEALNTDFRYQLTSIGQFSQAIVASEINNHQFVIRTDKPNVKVSWQVTAVRQDAFAKAHPLVVEEEKDARLRGFYIHPELYNAPEEKQVNWARHPAKMQRMKEIRTRGILAAAGSPRETAK